MFWIGVGFGLWFAGFALSLALLAGVLRREVGRTRRADDAEDRNLRRFLERTHARR